MFWKRKPKIATTACFWASDQGCSAGFAADVNACIQRHCGVLVVSHFTLTHERVSQRLSAAGIRSVTLSTVEDLAPNRIEPFCRSGSVALIPFPLVQLAAPFSPSEGNLLGEAAILVPEVHPTRRRDALVEQFAASLPFNASVTFYASLESPLMCVFGSERIRAIMQRLGLNEGERLEHRFLADSLRRAQQRIEVQVQQEAPATSQKEWFERNLPKADAEQMPGR